ncbi:MAG TPA: hypothetical protein VIG33_15160 [Pseudobdellovibrionaceae bacterium]|jgi:hypothetical protein
MKGLVALGVCVLFMPSAQAETVLKSPQERENTYLPLPPKPCESFKEFQRAYESLVSDNDLALGEEKAARLALQVSQGCNGSAQRFSKAYEMMKKTGVALTKAVEVGLDFSGLDDEHLKNFQEVFSKMYLENSFDFDFATAYRVSFQLSRDYEGKAQDVREDFTKLVKFCIQSDQAALPLRQCAELALKIVEHTPKFPGGLYSSFEKFYTFLRTDKRMGFSVLDSLNLVPRVFAYGPKAPENFKEGIEYALSSKKITIDHPNALNLALRLAKQSLPTPTKEEINEAPTKK